MVATSAQRGLTVDQFNNQMAVIQAQAKLAMPIGQERKPTRRWKESTEKMVILLFTRLADLFGSKAASKGLIIYFDQNKNIYSEQFDLWCWKLDDLMPEDFKNGMKGLEKRSEDQYREGGEMWPPSYAEFRALAFPASNRDTLAHKTFDKPALPEPKEYKSKRYEEGLKQTAALLAMLDDKPEPKTLTQDEINDLQRLERILNDAK
jgi:hypothetical protein